MWHSQTGLTVFSVTYLAFLPPTIGVKRNGPDALPPARASFTGSSAAGSLRGSNRSITGTVYRLTAGRIIPSCTV